MTARRVRGLRRADATIGDTPTGASACLCRSTSSPRSTLRPRRHRLREPLDPGHDVGQPAERDPGGRHDRWHTGGGADTRRCREAAQDAPGEPPHGGEEPAGDLPHGQPAPPWQGARVDDAALFEELMPCADKGNNPERQAPQKSALNLEIRILGPVVRRRDARLRHVLRRAAGRVHVRRRRPGADLLRVLRRLRVEQAMELLMVGIPAELRPRPRRQEVVRQRDPGAPAGSPCRYLNPFVASNGSAGVLVSS